MNPAAVRWGYAAAAGGLFALALPPFAAWPAAFVAPALLMRAVRRARTPREAADLGVLAGFVFAAAAMPWLRFVFGPFVVGLWAYFGLGPALVCASLKRLEERGDWFWAAAAGVLWAGAEAARAFVPRLACPWLSVGFAFVPAEPFLQAASAVGVYGLSAAAVAYGAALALAAEGRRLPALAMTAALGLAWGLGERRLERPLDGSPVSVALVQDETYDVARLAARTPRDADIVVWPEYQAGMLGGGEERFRRHLAELTAGRRGVLVAGAAKFDDTTALENFAWVLGPDGRLLGRHDKQHPIPFMERGLAGHSDPRPVPTPAGPVGVQICYDLDFEDGSRALARRGARILLVPNLDPVSWGPLQHAQHSGMAPLRAVETGLWVAKAASSGDSMLVDPRGRVRARLGFAASGVVRGTAALRASDTVYVAWGWLVVPLSLAALAAASLWPLLNRTLKSALTGPRGAANLGPWPPTSSTS